MRFWNWLKSLFKKSAPAQPPASSIPSVPIKGWNPYWGEVLSRLITNNLAVFDKASDIRTVRPDWFSLTETQKTAVLVEFFKTLIYYESGYNPLSESVDVGNKYDKETWSVGLLQLSGVDKANLGLPVGFDYEGLKDPINNITQGIAIMVNQINKRGKILISNTEKGNPSKYWATINPGNKYDKSKQIIAAANKLVFSEKPKETIINATPWMDIALKEIGVSESGNPKRVIEYHQATSLKAKDTQTAWCSSFANWVVKQAGVKGTNSAWARDWLSWGKKCDLKYGCVVILERNAPGGDSHVGFYSGIETPTHIEIISGNCDNMVKKKLYAKKDLLGTRWPIKA